MLVGDSEDFFMCRGNCYHGTVVGNSEKMKLHCAVQKREVKNTGEVVFLKKEYIGGKKGKGEGKNRIMREKREGKRWCEKRVEDFKWRTYEDHLSLEKKKKKKEKVEGARRNK